MTNVDNHAEAVLVANLDPLLRKLLILSPLSPFTCLRSATERSIDSPVVPQTNTPFTWFLTRCWAVGSTTSKLRVRSSFIGLCTAQHRPSKVKELGSFALFIPN